MRLVQIRASSEQELDCLLRELAAYGPIRSRQSVVVELEDDSQAELLAMLTALEACLEVNEIRSVRVKLDGESYMLATQ